MKKLLLLLNLMFISQLVFAQSKMIMHTATAENTFSDFSEIDHPDLNGNPNAGIIVTHNWNGMGTSGVYNDHVTGVWYDSVSAKWCVFNQDSSPMVIGSKYNVLIGDPENFFIHTANSSNIEDGYSTFLPSLYGEDYLFFNTVFVGNSDVLNNKNYSWDFLSETRYLYTPSFENIPMNAKFLIYDPIPSDIMFTHISSVINNQGNRTIIDHPSLNNNPNATFIINHFYGIGGPETNNNINKTLGVYYAAGNWRIYTEDQTEMPSGLAFDILVADNEMSTNELLIKEEISVSPNPVVDHLKIHTTAQVEKVQIMNMAGQIISELKNTTELNMSSLPAGLYLIHIHTKHNLITKKVIKK